jgi:hypothetical protein
MKASSDIIYISDQYYVFCYETANLKLSKKLGGKGEGPGNFWMPPSIKVYKNKMMAYIPYRLVLYSKAGEKVIEKKLPEFSYDVGYVNGNYVLSSLKFEQGGGKYHTLNFTLFDSNLKKITSIHSVKKSSSRAIKKVKRFLIKPLDKFICYGGNIFVAKGHKDLYWIDIHDHEGNLLKTIRREYKKIRIPESDKKRRLEEHKNIPVVKKRWKSLIKLFDYTFPEFYPPLQDFRVVDKKIYLKTFQRKNQKVENFLCWI